MPNNVIFVVVKGVEFDTERRNGTANLFVGLHGDYNGIKGAQRLGGMTPVHVVVVSTFFVPELI